MTNRLLVCIVRDQKPLVAPLDETVRHACHAMWQREAGSVLVVDKALRLAGIFTGRDAVRLLAKGGDAASVRLDKAMTRKPVTLPPEARAVDAVRAMCVGGFRHVPIVSEERVLGVVSRGDIRGMEFEEFICRNTGLPAGGLANRTVRDAIRLRRPPVHNPDDSVAQACRSMLKHAVGATLVTDKRQRLQGIFTGRDAVHLLATEKDAAAVPLRKAMSRDPVTVGPDDSAIDALRAMNDGGFRHLPVIDDGKVVGIVSRADFTGVELDRLEEEVHLKECIW